VTKAALFITVQESFLLWGSSNTAAGSPEWLWSLHPCRHSKSNWTGSWAIRSSCPCFEQECWDWTTPRSPFRLQPFLWCCSSICEVWGTFRHPQHSIIRCQL